MLLFLIGLPLAGGGLAFFALNSKQKKLVLVASAAIHTLLVVSLWGNSANSQSTQFLGLDALGQLVLLVVSVLFLAIAVYSSNYFTDEEIASNRMFFPCMLFFLGAITVVTTSRHMGLLWIGIEATTLFSAPLIFFQKTPQSIEATWKYLLVCSVGIALALMGTLFLAVSAKNVSSIFVNDILYHARLLSVGWLKLSIIFLLIGFGTKMGLAPMHTWLSDAHGEAPSPVSALLSGALLNIAFLGIARVFQIAGAADLGAFAQDLLFVLSVMSLGIAAFFIVGQLDYKRMFAYSSIENMGIIALGMAVGGIGWYAALFHMINNAFAKAMTFLLTGNLYKFYGSKKVSDVRGLLNNYPMTGFLFLMGFMAISGIPPFGTFYSELMVLFASMGTRHYVAAFFYILFLAVIFIGMARNILTMVYPDKTQEITIQIQKEKAGLNLPIIFLGVVVLSLGLYMPVVLQDILKKASALLSIP
jgi:hydrogenase-4 component F